MTDKIKKAISILEVNKLISSSQTEFCESVDLAIKALEKQIPKKPVLVTRGLIKFYPCPNADCSNPNKYMQVYPNQKYCVYCGQKLDWSDKDDI